MKDFKNNIAININASARIVAETSIVDANLSLGFMIKARIKLAINIKRPIAGISYRRCPDPTVSAP